jgi:hypothetical protein
MNRIRCSSATRVQKLGMIILVHEMERQQHGFLECLSPGSGFRWLAIVLLERYSRWKTFKVGVLKKTWTFLNGYCEICNGNKKVETILLQFQSPPPLRILTDFFLLSFDGRLFTRPWFPPCTLWWFTCSTSVTIELNMYSANKVRSTSTWY